MSTARLGKKVRALRRQEGLTQVKFAERLGISASYLNLIEHDKRPLTAPLLIKLASQFQVDVTQFAGHGDTQTISDLMEVFGEPMFDGLGLTKDDVQELATGLPSVARAVVMLYRNYRSAREAGETLANRVADHQDHGSVSSNRLPSEEVTDLIQRNRNHFPELESAAEALWRDAKLESDSVYTGMVRYLDRVHGVDVKIARSGSDRAIRRYDPVRRRMTLSESLDRATRNFQLAAQIGLLTQDEILARMVRDPQLTSDESRTLTRMVLANYFAGAVLMPYEPFIEACRRERHDIELISRQFGQSFEQVCHRMTTLRRPGREGVPFHLVKIDTAGNISKRFSASGIRFARFGGACPRWNVSMALLESNRIRIQLSEMPDGTRYFCVAKTLKKRRGGYGSPDIVHAIGLGCTLDHASDMVYSDGIDLQQIEDRIIDIGVTCRLCERSDCDQRAFPSLRSPLRLDENVRGTGFYTHVAED